MDPGVWHGGGGCTTGFLPGLVELGPDWNVLFVKRCREPRALALGRGLRQASFSSGMLWNENNIGTFKAVESVVMDLWARSPALTDHGVGRAYEALHQAYDAEGRGRRGRPHRLSGLDLEVHDAVRSVCEYLLGRGPLPPCCPPGSPRAPLEQVRDCLRELGRSVERHHRRSGELGYLRHVARYLPTATGSTKADAASSPGG